MNFSYLKVAFWLFKLQKCYFLQRNLALERIYLNFKHLKVPFWSFKTYSVFIFGKIFFEFGHLKLALWSLKLTKCSCLSGKLPPPRNVQILDTGKWHMWPLSVHFCLERHVPVIMWANRKKKKKLFLSWNVLW